MQKRQFPASRISRKIARAWLCGIAGPLLIGANARLAVADKINMPAAAMRDLATDIVVGKVVSIGQKVEDHDAFRYTYYTAHVKIARIEKGASLKGSSECDVRYWHRDYKPGEGPRKVGDHYVIPAGSMGASGHRGMPRVDETRRFYLARNAYDGFTTANKDGGYNVIGPNGFEELPVKTKRKAGTHANPSVK